MKIALPFVMVAAAIVFTPVVSRAQAAVPAPAQAPAPVASAPREAKGSTKPAPQLMSPAQKRDVASGDLKPERPVVPQVTIPLNSQDRAKARAERRAPKRGAAASGSGINDDVARCEAKVDAQARAACRNSLPQDKR